MIIGVIYRNYKSYKNITYIPISNGDSFCGLIGRNGVGKSSVLESLDVFFNKRQFNRNVNNPNDEAYIVPIFCIKKDQDLPDSEIARMYSDKVWDCVLNPTSTQINHVYMDRFKTIQTHVHKILESGVSRESHYLLPIGIDQERKPSLGIFRDNVFTDAINPQNEDCGADARVSDACEKMTPIVNFLESWYQYVYIPKDVEPEKIVQFETKEIQTLLGEKLENIVSELLTKENISKISSDLKKFIEDLSSKITGYKFKTPSKNQPNLKPDKIYSLIIEDFFSIRELHKEISGGKDISLKQLSSGEKQQAILTLIYSIIKNYRNSDDTNKLIIAVDEPEASLHVSVCYDQFEQLNELSKYCCQVLVTSHWYGFIPAMLTGSITNICGQSSDVTGARAYIFNIHKYREEIKHKDDEHKRSSHESLPIDVMLKSSNDFTQSILLSVINETQENVFNWLICEGSSDKIYLEAYLSDLIETKNLRVIPVCSATEVKKTYYRLQVLFEEVKSSLKGKVFLLIDTDANSMSIETKDNLDESLRARRIVNDLKKKETILVHTKSATNPKSPNTDIEDALDSKCFIETLCEFKNNDLLSFLDDNIPQNLQCSSYWALDLRESQREKIDQFFNANNGNNKVLFAKKYVEKIGGDSKVPNWIQEIRDYFEA